VFQAREVGGVLTALYGLVLLVQLREFRMGPDAFAWFASVMASPPMVALSLVVLVFVGIHAVTWFAALAKSQPGRASRPLPWRRVLAALLVVWAHASAAVMFLWFGGL
jgi:fumarate reductase subunit C